MAYRVIVLGTFLGMKEEDYFDKRENKTRVIRKAVVLDGLDVINVHISDDKKKDFEAVQVNTDCALKVEVNSFRDRPGCYLAYLNMADK